MPTLPDKLPEASATIFKSLLMREPLDKAEIQEQLDEYLETLEMAAEDQIFDIELAQRIHKSLSALLERVDQDYLCYVQAASVYFLEDDDATPDLESSLGFEDDATVANAVIEMLGHTDLIIRLFD